MVRPSKVLLNYIYHKLFEHFSAHVYWVDEQGLYLGCNKRYCQFIKITNDAPLKGQNHQQYILNLGVRFENKKTSSTKRVRTYEKIYSFDENLCKTFRVTEVTCFGVTLFYEEDISDYLNQIEALENQYAKLRVNKEQTDAYLNNVIQIVPASIYWKNTDSIILGSNLFHTHLAGFSSPDEVIGKTEYDFVWKEQAKEIIETDQKIMALGQGQRIEETATLSDGEVHTFMTSKEPLRDKDNRVIGIIGISLDITEQKQAELKVKQAEAISLMAKSKADSEEEMRKMVMVLVGDIVHDLRTPIATIRTIADLLSSMFPRIFELIEEAKKLGAVKINLFSKRELNHLYDNTIVSSLKSSVKMMDDFINSTLIELANAQKGQQQALIGEDLTKCSSRRILENTLDAYPFDEGIKIHEHTSYDFFLMGNTILIMKILFNIIRNALEQISLNGKGDLTIITEDAGAVNLIKIRDTAGGAPPDVVDKLFSGYFTTKQNGTGIGLASCKRIMQNFGGDLTFNTVYGDYMEFVLSFPKINSE
jgi:PAS domain S-box-containing protein